MRAYIFYFILITVPNLWQLGLCKELELGCRNEEGNIVEWFYLYKLPKTLEPGIDDITDENVWKSDGLDYLYISSEDQDGVWKKTTLKIDSPESIPGQTIAPLYDSENSLAAVFYNDEPPIGKPDMTNGHTKGVMASNDKTGFWLVHSVPHFPPNLPSGPYDYPKSGHIYAQSFLCITMDVDEVNKAAEQLLYNEPHIYSYLAPDDLKESLPNLYRAVQNETVNTAPYWNKIEIKSHQGTKFQSFAKSHRFQKDLYEDWLAPALNSDLDVETWRHGTGNLPSNCSLPQKVQNIKMIEIPEINHEFETLKDHSKWAVSTDESKEWICVGDINRQQHQKVRGGGTVCQQSKSISQAYRKLVKDIESCPKSIAKF